MPGGRKVAFFFQFFNIKALAIVCNFQMQGLGIVGKGNFYLLCCRILDGIVNRFLTNPVKVIFNLSFQPAQKACFILKYHFQV